MFITHKSNVNKHIIDSEIMTVSGVELSAYDFWFLCEVPEHDDDNEVICSTTLLLDDINVLAEIANSKKPAKAYLVSPGYKNKSENWVLQILKTVYKADYSFEDGNSCIYRFETENGQAFDQDISGMNKNTEGLNFQTILRFD